jgi:uncharacterized membrane protein YfcA
MEAIPLCAFAFLAGLVDSIVGGGGLIQLPALFIFLPEADLASVLGTNKLAAIAGTGLAVARYRASVGIRWTRVLPGAACALFFAIAGAAVVRLVGIAAKIYLRPVILVLLVAVAAVTFRGRTLGTEGEERPWGKRESVISIGIGAAVGFYDGFLGPGTGSFLIFLFVWTFHLSFLRASAEAKVVNFATNLGAVIYFVATGSVFARVALLMAPSNMAGALVGTRLAVLRGNQFVRALFLVVVALTVGRFGYDTLRLLRTLP